jgi:hypothetical protein
MEELKITIMKDSNTTAEELAQFIQNFNLLKMRRQGKKVWNWWKV